MPFALSVTDEHPADCNAAARQIPRPAGENAGLRDDASWCERWKDGAVGGHYQLREGQPAGGLVSAIS